jgi:cytochrome c biogenesis protein CcmG/thiol:disulfide interchange protein DsbE
LILRAGQVLAVSAVMALLGVLVWQVAHDQASDLPSKMKAGETVIAPPFTKPRIDAEGTLSLASLRGKVVVLNFWQSYCPPCENEAPYLVAAEKQWRGKDVVFLGVDVQDLRGEARAFMERFGITYPNVADRDGNLYGRYGVVGFPETFFIDAKGRAVAQVIGEISQQELNAGIREARGSV